MRKMKKKEVKARLDAIESEVLAFKRDERGNPIFTIDHQLEIERMDWSLPAFHQQVMTFTERNTGRNGDVAMGTMSCSMSVSIKDKDGKNQRLYGVYLKPILDLVIAHDEKMRAVKKLPSPKA